MAIERMELATVPYEDGFITSELVCYYVPPYGGEKAERWRKKIYYPVAQQKECFDKYMLKSVGNFLYDIQGKPKWTPKKPRGVPPWDNF
jgi:hypothetical protein